MATNTGKYQFKTISDKKDFGSLGIPNYIIEYDPLDLQMKCPRFHRQITGEEKIVEDDLDVIQLELETMLVDTTKRLRLLKNELNLNEIKMLKNNMETSGELSSIRKLPKSNQGKTFEKYFDRVTFKNRTKLSNRPNYTNLERFVLSPYPVLSDVDTSSQFWSYIHQFHDVSPGTDEMKAADQFVRNEQDLSRIIPAISKKITKNETGTSKLSIETGTLAPLLEKFLQNNTGETASTTKRPGLLTQRIMDSFIKDGSEKLTKINRSSNLHELERSLYQTLQQQELIQSPSNSTTSNGPAKLLKRLNEQNENRLRRKFSEAFNDMIHDANDRQLTNNFMEMFTTYKKLRSGQPSLADYRQFDQLWQRRLQLVRRLNQSNRL